MTVLFKKSEMRATLRTAAKIHHNDVWTEEQKAAYAAEAQQWLTDRFFRKLNEMRTEARSRIAKLAAKLSGTEQSPAYTLGWSTDAFEAAGVLEVMGRVDAICEHEQWQNHETITKIVRMLNDEYLLTYGSLSMSTSPTANLIERAKQIAAQTIVRESRY